MALLGPIDQWHAYFMGTPLEKGSFCLYTIKAADGIKVTNQLSLKLRAYPELSGWVQYNHRDP